MLTSPSSASGSADGIASTRKARPVTSPARSLPSTISSGLSRLACSVARVPALRSPLIDPAESAGVTSSIASSTRIICRLNITRATSRTTPHSVVYSAGARDSTPMPNSRRVQMPSATYQRAERIRWRSSSEVTSHRPRGRSARVPPRGRLRPTGGCADGSVGGMVDGSADGPVDGAVASGVPVLGPFGGVLITGLLRGGRRPRRDRRPRAAPSPGRRRSRGRALR